MDSQNLSFLTLDNVSLAKCWLVSFDAHCRTNHIKDELNAEGTSPKTDKFLEKCGGKALLKISALFPGKSIENVLYKDIKAAILAYIEPQARLTIADRTNFLQMQQGPTETEYDFLARINEASNKCNWDKLKESSPSTQLIKLKFIAGLVDEKLKMKVLEKVQLNPKLTVTELVDFCQMARQIDTFVSKPHEQHREEPLHHVKTKKFPIQSKAPCTKCGRKHAFRKCPAFGKKCTNCGNLNHFNAQCRNKQTKYTRSTHNIETESLNQSSIFSVNYSSAKPIIKVANLFNVPLEFQMDTGASISVLSEKQWKQIGSPKLTKPQSQPTNFDGSKLETIGELSTSIIIDNRAIQATFIVVKSNRPYGLLGRNVVNTEDSTLKTFSIETQFLPTITDFEATIVLTDENAPMKFCKARGVPIHLKSQLDNEIDALERQGIISHVNSANFASPVVWVKKPNGRYRMCVDYKATLNKHIQSDAYPLPTAEEIFSQIGDAKYFAKVDLKSAYWQIALDQKAKKLSVINTHKGLFQLNRLQMGLKNASAIFQRCLESILKGLPGVIVYQDDVMIFSTTNTQLKKRIKAVLARLRERNVTINSEKCVHCTESLKFLGFIFSSNGIKTDPNLVEKIKEIPAPTNVKELESFLGLINYYGRFIQNFSNICSPLFKLKKKDEPFSWNKECQEAFESLKQQIISAPILQPFSIEKHTVLTVDASMKSLGAVLTQEGHPILFISKTLTKTESNYSNIEREALAAVWACKRLEHFLLGKKFTLETDNKPLTHILNAESEVKTDISPRLLRLSLKMMRYDYNIQHVAGKANVIADTLSRIQSIDTVKLPEIHFFVPSVDIEELKNETERDQFLQDIKKRITSGNWQNTSDKESSFKRIMMQLTVDKDGLIRYCDRIVPPQSMYSKIFDVAHQSHNGINSTLILIQKEFYWPNMKTIVESQIRGCSTCAKARFQSTPSAHTWPKESSPWSRVHIDWAYSRTQGNILVIVDSYSGWLEACICKDRQSYTVISCLRSIFARFGIPLCLVSDNAPEFTTPTLSNWLKSIGCKTLHTPEYHPKSNGLAERMVRVIKSGLSCYNPSKSTFNEYLHRLLLVHRNTSLREGRTPAELLLGRKVRCPILSHFKPMQELLYKASTNSPVKSVEMIYRTGHNTSLVKCNDGRTITAHDSQLNSAPPNERERPQRIRKPVRRYPDVDPLAEGRRM